MEAFLWKTTSHKGQTVVCLPKKDFYLELEVDSKFRYLDSRMNTLFIFLIVSFR